MSNLYSILLARYHFYPEVKTRGMGALPQLALFTSEHVSGYHTNAAVTSYMKKKENLASSILLIYLPLAIFWRTGCRRAVLSNVEPCRAVFLLRAEAVLHQSRGACPWEQTSVPLSAWLKV